MQKCATSCISKKCCNMKVYLILLVNIGFNTADNEPAISCIRIFSRRFLSENIMYSTPHSQAWFVLSELIKPPPAVALLRDLPTLQMETESDTSVVVDDKLRELQASIFVNFFYLISRWCRMSLNFRTNVWLHSPGNLGRPWGSAQRRHPR